MACRRRLSSPPAAPGGITPVPTQRVGAAPAQAFGVVEHRVPLLSLADVGNDDDLAAWYNRISLALGYQPFYTEVSIYHNVGKLSSAGGPNSTGHIRGFTYRSLIELLKEHRFKIIRVFGVHDFHIPPPLNIIDRTAAFFPSLASCIVVMFKKS